MGVLLDKYSGSFTWFSLRPPNTDVENPYTIPYSHVDHLRRPARFPGLRQYLNLGPWARSAGREAAAFGRAQNVDVVLADLALEAVVAGRVAARILKVPLLASVKDDPVNRIRVKGTPAWLVKWFDTQFAKTMRTADKCAVIGNAMGEVYQRRYGVETTTLFIGVEKDKCLPARALDRDKAPFVIGSVGSVNYADNWNLLVEALRLLNQKYGSGRFRLLHIGRLPDGLQVTDDVAVTGWVPEKEFVFHLSRLDAGFLNYSFAPAHAETGRTSFPLKTHSYIQAQIPMLALGPADSSSVRFVEEYQCGVVCAEADAGTLAARLERLFFQKNVYTEAQAAVEQLTRLFSREQFFQTFESFVRVANKSN